jgi:hypothetical protein
LFQDNEFRIGQRFNTRKQAEAWAVEERKFIEKGGA